jgi:hypothetical protein
VRRYCLDPQAAAIGGKSGPKKQEFGTDEQDRISRLRLTQRRRGGPNCGPPRGDAARAANNGGQAMRFTFVVAGLFMLPAFAGGCAAAWRKNFKNCDWDMVAPRAVLENQPGTNFGLYTLDLWGQS